MKTKNIGRAKTPVPRAAKPAFAKPAPAPVLQVKHGDDGNKPKYTPKIVCNDQMVRDVLLKGGADLSQHVLKGAMSCNRWFSLTKEPLPSDASQVRQVVVITMPEALQPFGLETLAACARKLNCGVFVNRSLHEILSAAGQPNDSRQDAQQSDIELKKYDPKDIPI